MRVIGNLPFEAVVLESSLRPVPSPGFLPFGCGLSPVAMGRSAVVDWGKVSETMVVSCDDMVYGIRPFFSAEIASSFISS